MSQSWNDYEKAADKGPLSLAIKLVVGALIVAVVIGAGGFALGTCGEAAQVAKEEYGARATVRKYEWFKDTAQSLQKQQADIQVQDAALVRMKVDYGDAMLAWPRDVRETYEQRRAELIGVKNAFNRTAAEYNANVRKVNWAHVNVDALPAEFSQYVTQ